MDNIAEGFGRRKQRIYSFLSYSEVPVVKQKHNYSEPSTENI
jgi:hypothetical protein